MENALSVLFEFLFLNFYCSYAEYGTMLEIRDWILLDNGCSILTTVGVRRFHVLTRGERDGYDTAKVEFFRDQPVHVDMLPGEMYKRTLI